MLKDKRGNGDVFILWNAIQGRRKDGVCGVSKWFDRFSCVVCRLCGKKW